MNTGVASNCGGTASPATQRRVPLRLTVDVRKAFDTGIGTCIRQLVPRVARALPEVRIEAVINRGQASRHRYLEDCNISFVEVSAAPLSIREQWELLHLVRRDGLFWATSLAHPLCAKGPIVNTVYDLAQLALPESLGGSTRQRLLARPFFERIRRRSSRVLFISDFTAAEFRRLVGEPAGPSEVIPLGVDPSWFADCSDADRRPLPGPYFVMLGNLRPHKNLAMSLRAMAILAEQLPHKLLIIGPDRALAHDDQALRSLLDTVSDRVVFAGSLPQPEVQAALHFAEALLFTSHYEGFGLPVLEAMACGCPVLVARNGISPDLAGPGVPNFNPDDPAELAGLMLAQAGASAAELSRRQEAGVNRARLYSWDQAAGRTAEALLRAAHKSIGLSPSALVK